MSMVGFPLLLIPLAVYNIIVFLMPGVALAEPVFTLPLLSGAGWPVTLGDIMVTLGILLLLLELIKGARPGAKYLIDHLLSLVICGGAIAEFLLLPRFANSTFFLLALLALTEFLSGIAMRTRRGMPATVAVRRSSPVVEPLQESRLQESHLQESQARHEPEMPASAPAHVEPVEHHDPVPAILEKETAAPAPEPSSPPSQPHDDPRRPSGTSQ